MHRPAAFALASLWVSCSPASVSLSGPPRVVLLRGFGGSLPVDVTRHGFSGPVTVALDRPPLGVSAAPIVVTASHGVLQIEVDRSAAEGSLTLSVMATSNGGSASISLPALVRGGPGALDETFASGLVLADPGGSGSVARAAAVAPDGRILLAGYSQTDHARTTVASWFPDGGAGPVVVVDDCATADNGAFAIAVSTDTVVLAGDTHCGNGVDIAVTRLHLDLTPDTHFGPSQSGHVAIDLGGNGSAYAVALQPDGRILVGGSLSGASAQLVLARLTPEGRLDPTFADAGVALWTIGAGLSGSIQALSLNSLGAITFGGFGGDQQTSVLGRVRIDGSIDSSFGDGGWVLSSLGAVSNGWALAADPGGNLLFAGAANDGTNDFNWALERMDSRGNPDVSFGKQGLISTDLGAMTEAALAMAISDAVSRLDVDGDDDVLYGLAVDSDETLVGAGAATAQGGSFMSAIRLWQ